MKWTGVCRSTLQSRFAHLSQNLWAAYTQLLSRSRYFDMAEQLAHMIDWETEFILSQIDIDDKEDF